MRLRQENCTVETPDDGDPRWPIILQRMTQVHTKFAPLPDCSVLGMYVAFIVRKMNPAGYTETIYLYDEKDAARLLAVTEGVDWGKVEDWVLNNPGHSVLQIIEKLEHKEIPL